jgi:hypothetical protein
MFCHRPAEIEEVHIGKSSMGWKFHFHLEAFQDPANWKEELKGKVICDNYGAIIPYALFVEMVESAQKMSEPSMEIFDEEDRSCGFIAEFLQGHQIINGYHFYSGEWS